MWEDIELEHALIVRTLFEDGRYSRPCAANRLLRKSNVAPAFD